MCTGADLLEFRLEKPCQRCQSTFAGPQLRSLDSFRHLLLELHSPKMPKILAGRAFLYLCAPCIVHDPENNTKRRVPLLQG